MSPSNSKESPAFWRRESSNCSPEGAAQAIRGCRIISLAPRGALMKKLFLVFIVAAASTSFASQADKNQEAVRWEQEARNVAIIRDDWGIAHVYGKTDANVVFGMIYAQAEDDFNRVETNYINAMGRLSEAEGSSQILRDLRIKLFVNTDTLKAKYTETPAWLKTLMVSWADGLNYY